MFKVENATQADIDIMNTASKANLNFRFGKHTRVQLAIEDVIKRRLKTYKIVKNGEQGHTIGKINGIIKALGAFYQDKDMDYHMEQYSCVGMNPSERKALKSTVTHEWGHLFVTAGIEAISKDKVKETADYSYKTISAGLIKKYDKNTKRSEYFGRMFSETYNEIMTRAMSQFYDARENGGRRPTVDQLLFTTDCLKGMNDSSGYKKLMPITMLLMNAFNNTTENAFETFAQNDIGIVCGLHHFNDGTYGKLNDFIYGMSVDLIHVLNEYDSVMGTGSFERLAKKCDFIHNEYNAGRGIAGEDVKNVMKEIAVFTNRRSYNMLRTGKIDSAQKSKSFERFNKLWNEMYGIYGVSFSSSEIDEIYSRSR